jgi:hypothetical protein
MENEVSTPIIKHIYQGLTKPEDMEKSSMKMAFFVVLLVFAAGIYIAPFFSLIFLLIYIDAFMFIDFFFYFTMKELDALVVYLWIC